MKHIANLVVGLSGTLLLLGLSPAHAVDCDDDTSLSEAGLPMVVVDQFLEDAGCSQPEPASVDGPAPGTDVPTGLSEARALLAKGKGRAATLALAPLFGAETGADEAAVRYVFAQGLEEMGADQAAGVLYESLARQQGTDSRVSTAIQGLDRVSTEHGDFDAMTRVALRIDPGQRPSHVESRLAYLTMTEHFRAGNDAAVKQEFERVRQNSVSYFPALFTMGLAFERDWKLKSAVRSFRDVYRDSQSADSATAVEQGLRLQLYSLWNIGRIYYQIDRYVEAEEYYRRLLDDAEKNSAQVTQGGHQDRINLELAWSLFMNNELDEALATLNVIGPSYLPKQHRLRWTIAIVQGDHSTALEEVDHFQASFGPVAQALRSFVDTPEDEAVAAWFGADGLADQHPALTSRLRLSRSLTGAMLHLDAIDAERKSLGRQPGSWQNALGGTVDALLVAERERVQRQAGRHLVEGGQRNLDDLDRLMAHQQLVRTELTYMVGSSTLAPAAPDLELSCAVANETPAYVAAAAGVERDQGTDVDWLPNEAAKRERNTRHQVLGVLADLASDETRSPVQRVVLSHSLAQVQLGEADQVARAEASCRAAWRQACQDSETCALSELVVDESASRMWLDQAAQNLRSTLALHPESDRAWEIRSTLAAVLWETGDHSSALDELAVLLEVGKGCDCLGEDRLQLGEPAELRALLEELGRPELAEPLEAMR